VPLFLGQGEADPPVEPSVQAAYVENLCGQGQVVEYHTYAELDYLGVVQEGSPMIDDLMNWTTARLMARPQQPSAPTRPANRDLGPWLELGTGNKSRGCSHALHGKGHKSIHDATSQSGSESVALRATAF
jgi:hypothetical protein